MQGLDWHVTGAYGIAKQCDESEPFLNGGKRYVMVLVENQEELDLVAGLELLYGGKAEAQIWDGTGITGLRAAFSLIYTTWDPFDPNRI